MRNNIRLGLERGTNLDNLEIMAGKNINEKKFISIICMNIDDLNNNSQQFSYTAHQVQRKYWWKNVTVNIYYDLFSFLERTFSSSAIDVGYFNSCYRYNPCSRNQ